MVENKKSFVLYSDSQGLVNQLPDDVAGRLFKHIYAFVNEQNPISEELLLNIAFEPIKMQLKRDLLKWESQLEQRRQAGLRSAEVRKRNSTSVNERSISSTDNVNVNDNVSVTVNDNVNDNDILLKKETKKDIIVASQKKFNFRLELIEYGFFENLVDDWLLVRKNKKASNTETAFKTFINEIESRNCNINEMLQIAVSNSWSSFKHNWVDNLKNSTNGKQDRDKSDADHKQSAVNAVNALFGIK